MRTGVRHALIISAIVVPSLAAGVGIGWFLTKRVLENDYERRLDEELEASRRHYVTISAEEKPSLDEVIAKREPVAAAALKAYGGNPAGAQKYLDIKPKAEVDEAVEEEQGGIVIRTVFTGETTTTVDMDGVDLDEPHIISKDDFFTNASELEQHTLTWYEEDRILADNDEAVEDPEKYVGEETIFEMFGHGSGDPNVVYIRSPKMHTEYEILRSTGSYAKEVQGL